MLNKLTYIVDMGPKAHRWGMLDYSLAGDMIYSAPENEATLSFRGEVYPFHNESVECPLPRSTHSYTPTGRMIDFFIDVFTINSGAYAF